jgi:ribosome-associated translation inhibitor RaiA
MAPKKRSPENKKAQQRRQRRESFPRAVPKAVKPTIGRSTTVETPLQLRAPGLDLGEEIREYIRSRVGFKLGKYALSVTRIVVGFERVTESNGNPGYTCRFRVLLPATREVIVEAGGAGIRTAFDLAVDATERAVRRLVERRRTDPRRRAGE